MSKYIVAVGYPISHYNYAPFNYHKAPKVSHVFLATGSVGRLPSQITGGVRGHWITVVIFPLIIWRFPKIGVPLNHPFKNDFPAIGDPHFKETSI